MRSSRVVKSLADVSTVPALASSAAETTVTNPTERIRDTMMSKVLDGVGLLVLLADPLYN